MEFAVSQDCATALHPGDTERHHLKNKNKKKKNIACLINLENSLKRANLRVTGLKEEAEKSIGVESLLKAIITDNFLNLEKDISIQYKKVIEHQADKTQRRLLQGI